ncbi:putative vegetative cell wall protein gp1 protein [Eutypa lata UCREL1]|uniref:Putative vegetative cell wall protein gp1 protein n=1 Tax=Eutypa lata (strain UCR-EL1) TaxID=1287681 RepID=M7TSF7_EUTLA|nr:putative vegetative cell wall protein gp1 protein [Eutypa lata UCREL1]
MSYGSPYGTTPRGDYNNNYYSSHSPSPTPSPHHYGGNYYPAAKTPQRPATRAHVRGASSGFNDFRPSTAFSPRYRSNGEYATGGAGPSPKVYPVYLEKERTEHARYEELPPRSATRLGNHTRTHVRHASSTTGHAPPVRPQTTRPSISQQKKAAVPPAKATEADAKKHKIPAGYSLKNWDPTEEPIMLLGSVFDANSLGKWVYDWTVYHHGPSTPIADVAGELWLLLIQLSGKVKRSEEVIPTVRAQENKEMLEDFIESGERLMDKLRSLLKRCEAPMLRATKRKSSAELGKNSGVEFVETMFGRERELEKTERFMQSVRLWNLRFDANCEDILKKPTA